MNSNIIKFAAIALGTTALCSFNAAAKSSDKISLKFKPSDYTSNILEYNGKTVEYRAYEKVIYVTNPQDTKYECMNIYIPEAYFENGSINGYNAKTAPIFMPNGVGGYMAAEPLSLEGFGGDACKYALSEGIIVASPGARGRTSKNGKAPSFIVDLKAAVRYIRFNDKVMPGDAEKIITNGTSAGGASSALLGVTGNSKDYEPYLKTIGAAKAKDNVYAASCYCPITNLDHANEAYEWQFTGHNDVKTIQMTMLDYKMERKEISETLDENQIQISKDLASLFPSYVNSLNLKDKDGNTLILDKDGNGSFKDYICSLVIQSAQKEMDKGTDMSRYPFLTIQDNKINAIDFDSFVTYQVRMKTPGAFDSVDATTGENNEFGDENIDYKHFTEYAFNHDTAGAPMANTDIIKMLNPMNYIGDRSVSTAPYWRIRHGTKDRDTGLAISAILNLTLQVQGYDVDYELPWDRPHSGDYDLNELFTWINKICRN